MPGAQVVSTAEQRELELSAFHHALAQSIVGIIGRDLRGILGTAIGTGTFIDLGGEKYVLTAEHVVHGCAKDELRFFLPFEGIEITETPKPFIPSPQNVGMQERLEIEMILSDEELDIALLKLSPSARLSPFWSFRGLERMPHPPGATSQFVMMGYPVQRSRVMRGNNLMVFRNVDYPELVPDQALLSGFVPGIHFLTDFPSADAFHPRGYSGSGLWKDKVRDESVWQTHPVYCGMELSYFPRKKLLQILGVNAILDFVERQTRA